jgi:hypothetical protein
MVPIVTTRAGKQRGAFGFGPPHARVDKLRAQQTNDTYRPPHNKCDMIMKRGRFEWVTTTTTTTTTTAATTTTTSTTTTTTKRRLCVGLRLPIYSALPIPTAPHPCVRVYPRGDFLNRQVECVGQVFLVRGRWVGMVRMGSQPAHPPTHTHMWHGRGAHKKPQRNNTTQHKFIHTATHVYWVGMVRMGSQPEHPHTLHGRGANTAQHKYIHTATHFENNEDNGASN